MHKIIHNRNKCIGCGICYERQPEVWRMSKKDGKAVLLRAAVKNDIHILAVSNQLELLSKEVAAACPAKIIKIL